MLIRKIFVICLFIFLSTAQSEPLDITVVEIKEVTATGLRHGRKPFAPKQTVVSLISFEYLVDGAVTGHSDLICYTQINVTNDYTMEILSLNLTYSKYLGFDVFNDFMNGYSPSDKITSINVAFYWGINYFNESMFNVGQSIGGTLSIPVTQFYNSPEKSYNVTEIKIDFSEVEIYVENESLYHLGSVTWKLLGYEIDLTETDVSQSTELLTNTTSLPVPTSTSSEAKLQKLLSLGIQVITIALLYGALKGRRNSK